MRSTCLHLKKMRITWWYTIYNNYRWRKWRRITIQKRSEIADLYSWMHFALQGRKKILILSFLQFEIPAIIRKKKLKMKGVERKTRLRNPFFNGSRIVGYDHEQTHFIVIGRVRNVFARLPSFKNFMLIISSTREEISFPYPNGKLGEAGFGTWFKRSLM